jgi:hypothetical protein
VFCEPSAIIPKNARSVNDYRRNKTKIILLTVDSIGIFGSDDVLLLPVKRRGHQRLQPPVYELLAAAHSHIPPRIFTAPRHDRFNRQGW